MVLMLLPDHVSPAPSAKSMVSIKHLMIIYVQACFPFCAIIEDTVTAFVGIRSCVSCPSGTTSDVTGFNCVGQTVSDVLYVHLKQLLSRRL